MNNETLLNIICAVATVPACVLTLIDSLHFFQLNSYKPKTHLRWLKNNPRKYLIMLAIGAAAAFSPLFGKSVVSASAFFVCMAAAAVSAIPKKAKKPLVYTPRVKRMMVTAFVVLALFVLIALLCGNNLTLLLLALIASLSPLLSLLANLINTPMEHSINKRYTEDAKRILAECRPSLKVIGITGSYGKTSVKYYLTSLLKVRYNTLMTPESYNTPMGVVKTIRGSLRSTHEIFVCEMGARNEGDIKELCDIVTPDHGIITAIGPQHLETFGSLDTVKKTKYELADALPAEGLLVLNGDDENVLSFEHTHKDEKYGTGDNCGYRAVDVSVSSRGTSFTVIAPNGERQAYSTRLIGKHNVVNLTGAIAAANLLGVSLSEMKGAVRKLEGVSHRLELLERNGVTLIDDAYNSNPSGTKAALEALSLFDGLKIIVTPGMVELGEKQEELNREFGADISVVCDYAVLVGEDHAKPIKQGLLDKGFSEDRIHIADTIEKALAFVYSIASDGRKKIVLLENDLPDNY